MINETFNEKFDEPINPGDIVTVELFVQSVTRDSNGETINASPSRESAFNEVRIPRYKVKGVKTNELANTKE